MTLRKLTRLDEVEFTYTLEVDDVPIEGNAMASGDDSVDQECYAWIRRELAHGNYAAWGSVLVTAAWKGFRGTAGLGGCSYETEKALWADLRTELEDEALDDLNASLSRTLATLEEIRSP